MTFIQDDLLHTARLRALLHNKPTKIVYLDAAAAKRAMQDLKRLYDTYSEPAPDKTVENEDGDA